MDFETLRQYCLSLPEATEDIQWQNDLLFRVGGKVFAIVDLEPPNACSFKCTPDVFAELIERDGIIPAPYVARYHWVQVQDFHALSASTFKKLIRQSYDLVFQKLPGKKSPQRRKARR